MALPAPIYQRLGWPWISFWDAGLTVKLLWNFGLFLAFGFFHSALAQRGPQDFFKKILPAQCVRAFYVCFTGATCLAVIGSWQNTGEIVWVIPGLSAAVLSVISALIFYPLLLTAFKVMHHFDGLEFLGFRQLYSSPDQIDRMVAGGELLETGIYGRVRHPIYFFTMLAFTVTPMMSLDRLEFIVACAVYLAIGIPVEERKLEKIFGDAYQSYRTRVPALVPRLSHLFS